MKDYYIYILTNKKHGTLYIGVTNNLNEEFIESLMKNVMYELLKGFTKRYNLNKLVIL